MHGVLRRSTLVAAWRTNSRVTSYLVEHLPAVHSYLWVVTNARHPPLTTPRGREVFLEGALDFLAGAWQSR